MNVPVETVHMLVERHGEEAYDILDKYLVQNKERKFTALVSRGLSRHS